MSYTVTDDEYGQPPERDEPLSLERDMMVYVCNVGGPIFTVEKGRIFETGMSKDDVRRKKGMATDSGVIRGDDGDTYVNVRYGTATMETCYVPEEYILEILTEECRWSTDQRGYVPV